MNSLTIMYVACGGAVGAVLRYLLVDIVARFNQTGFPFGTVSVNILGSLLMGVWVASVLVLPSLARAKDLHLLIAVGALGGFTTFSAFSMDVFLLAERGAYTQMAIYMLGSVLFSVLALLLGIALVKLVAA